MFSISKSNLPQVVRYIGNQREHHKTVSFEEELKVFLDKHSVAYDPRYLVG